MHVGHVTYKNHNNYANDEVINWDDIPSHIKSVTIEKFRMMR